MIEKQEKLKSAILIDYHKTIVDESGLINHDIASLINALANKFAILIFTADAFKKKDYDIACKLLKDNDIVFEKFLYVKEPLNHDEDTKIALYQGVKNKYDVKFILDNNKDVIKAFNKLGIYGLRAKEPKTYEVNY